MYTKEERAVLSKLDRQRKKEKLGMCMSAARTKLMRMIIWDQIAQHTVCYRCGEYMTYETYTFEHKIPWLNDTNPKDLYFNLDNISYSHSVCNKQANSSRTGRGKFSEEERLDRQRAASREWARRKRAKAKEQASVHST